jgi:hypothetical protein
MAHFRTTAILLLGLLLTGCGFIGGGSSDQAKYEPLAFDYLNHINLNVADIEVQNNFTPRGNSRHVEQRAPVRPVDALRRMATDRLLAGGTTGRAVFVIDDASIIQSGNIYTASFAIHLDVYGEGGDKRATVTARVQGSRPVSDDDEDSVRADLYALTRKMMDDMNVELEYQARRTLRDSLQSTSPNAPTDKVQTEDLGASPKPAPTPAP